MTDQADHPNSAVVLDDLRRLRQEWTDLSAAHADGAHHGGDASHPNNDSVHEALNSFERAASVALFELGCREKATDGPREDDLAIIRLLTDHWRLRLETYQDIARDQLERIITSTDNGLVEVSELINTVVDVTGIQNNLQQVMEAASLARPAMPNLKAPSKVSQSRQAVPKPAPRPSHPGPGVS